VKKETGLGETFTFAQVPMGTLRTLQVTFTKLAFSRG
jgi:hypothetical protein